MARVLFFGRLGDLAGGDERRLSLSEPMPIADLVAIISQTDPILAGALLEPRVRCALNGAIVSLDTLVRHGDELAFLPPVSGG